MTRSKQLLGAVSSIALVAFSASPALAEGTTAGQDITNNVSVTYDVGGVTQGAVVDSDTFTVDRKVNVTVAEVGGDTTEVAPGQPQAAIKFEVTNDSNDLVDLALSAQQSAADDFDITNIKFYVDNGDGIFNPADDLEVTYLDEMAADETRTVFIVGDIPTGVVTGDTADVALVANAHAAEGTAGNLGAELFDTAGGNTAGIDTVLADGAGDVDAANEGDFSDTDTYVVAAADVTVEKTSQIISDPVNGTTDPKAIPGAVVQYCIVVSNAAGSATATDVAVVDVLPADVTYDSVFGIFLNGDATCNGGAAGGAYDAGANEVSGTLDDIPASTSRSLYFRTTIN